MPAQIKDMYPTTRIVTDFTEIFIETPSLLNIQSSIRSSYKHHNTFKGLIGIRPTGVCILAISDQEITRYSGLLQPIEPGDSVMVNIDFDISYELYISLTSPLL